MFDFFALNIKIVATLNFEHILKKGYHFLVFLGSIYVVIVSSVNFILSALFCIELIQARIHFALNIKIVATLNFEHILKKGYHFLVFLGSIYVVIKCFIR